ncbi:hypothetical protein VTJ04DRAFT_5920 [Mycothermus thermophilus]|uniref:uncharacterized protein n=1 Tax=Humicola insolens TaxID=85995 RepID=UPI00374340DB
MGLLDLLTTLILHDSSNSMKIRNLCFLEHAKALASIVEEQNPNLMMTKPYVQWLLAKSLLEMEAPPAPQEEHHWENLKTLRLDQGPGINLPICVLARDAAKPDWNDFLYRSSATQKQAVEVAIRAAEEIGDYNLQSDAIKLLILQSDDPKPWFVALAKLHADVQGDKDEYLKTCLSSYLVPAAPSEEFDLLSHLLESVRRDGEDNNAINRCDNVTLRWACSIFRVFHHEKGGLQDSQPTSLAALFPSFDGSGLPNDVARFGTRHFDLPPPELMDSLSPNDPKRESRTFPSKIPQGTLAHPQLGPRMPEEAERKTGKPEAFGLRASEKHLNPSGWPQHPSSEPRYPEIDPPDPVTTRNLPDFGSSRPSAAPGERPKIVFLEGSELEAEIDAPKSSKRKSAKIMPPANPSIRQPHKSDDMYESDSQSDPEGDNQETSRNAVATLSIPTDWLRQEHQRLVVTFNTQDSEESRQEDGAVGGPAALAKRSLHGQSKSMKASRGRTSRVVFHQPFDISDVDSDTSQPDKTTSGSEDLEGTTIRVVPRSTATGADGRKMNWVQASTGGSTGNLEFIKTITKADLARPPAVFINRKPQPVEELEQTGRSVPRRSMRATVTSEDDSEGDVKNANPVNISPGIITPKDLLSKMAALSKLAETESGFTFVKGLLEIMDHANDRDVEGNTLLHVAVRHGDSQLVKQLVSCANEHVLLDINEKNKDGYAPLHLAVQGGNVEVVSALLRGSDRINVNVEDANGNTPLHLAAQRGFAPLVEGLLRIKDVNLNPINEAGRTPLHLAALSGHDAVVRELRDSQEIRINAHDWNDDTPLHLAARYGHSNVVRELLMSRDIDANIRNKNGQTPQDLAEEKSYASICELLAAKEGLVNTGGESSSSSPNQTLSDDDDRVCNPLDPLSEKGKGAETLEVWEENTEVVMTTDKPAGSNPVVKDI